MTLRTILIVGLAAVFGVAAAVYATTVVNSRNRDGGTVEKVRVVVVAAPRLARGTKLTAEVLDVKEVAKDDTPDDALHGVEDAVGRFTDAELIKGDYVREEKLTKGARATLVPSDQSNMQAVTIPTPTVAAGMAGFIHPGDKVDVLLTVDRFDPDDKTDRGGTIRLLQMIEVLAADKSTEVKSTAGPDGKLVEQRDLRSVTLLVTPRQAQIIADGQHRGTLSLALRHPDEKTVYPNEVVTPKDLKFPPRQDPKKPEAVAEPTRPALPRIIRGTAESPAGAP
jgi:pilus assembly protein CpaB